jgi:hypothetical protein
MIRKFNLPKKIETLSLGEKQRQWLWFAGLLFGGMAAMLLLAGAVRLLLGM